MRHTYGAHTMRTVGDFAAHSQQRRKAGGGVRSNAAFATEVGHGTRDLGATCSAMERDAPAV